MDIRRSCLVCIYANQNLWSIFCIGRKFCGLVFCMLWSQEVCVAASTMSWSKKEKSNGKTKHAHLLKQHWNAIKFHDTVLISNFDFDMLSMFSLASKCGTRRRRRLTNFSALFLYISKIHLYNICKLCVIYNDVKFSFWFHLIR